MVPPPGGGTIFPPAARQGKDGAATGWQHHLPPCRAEGVKMGYDGAATMGGMMVPPPGGGTIFPPSLYVCIYIYIYIYIFSPPRLSSPLPYYGSFISHSTLLACVSFICASLLIIRCPVCVCILLVRLVSCLRRFLFYPLFLFLGLM